MPFAGAQGSSVGIAAMDEEAAERMEMQVEQSEGAHEGVVDATMDFAGMHDDGAGAGSGDKMARSLWVGNLEPWMDGLWMKQVFMQAGVSVLEAKVIRTGGVPSGYGFAEFASVEEAAKVLEGYHGQPIPDHPTHKVFFFFFFFTLVTGP